MAIPTRADQPPSDRALILLSPGADVNQITETLEQLGGQVTHIFPPAAFIGSLPAGTPLPPGILALYRQLVDEPAQAGLSAEARRAVRVWNALLTQSTTSIPALDASGLEAELTGDALVAPTPETWPALSSDPTPDYYQTSEFLIGRVAVGLVLPESDGRVDGSTEDWTEAERALVLSEITAALDWWAAREERARLTFVYDDGTAEPTATGYEPITRRYSDQALWIAEVMAGKGYSGTSYFDQVRAHNNALRDAHHTDWAFTLFVVDSSNDLDNRFSDGYFAYAYLGGPFAVMTYGNNGYGPENMDAVAAHEIGHIFLALDQYYSARQPCTRQSGYLGVENQNSQYGSCDLNISSIMRGLTWPYRDGAVDEYARGQLGWRDSDGDDILDPVDTSLSLVSAGHLIDPDHPNTLTFSGSVLDSPYPSPLRRSVLINTIEQVHYRAGAGEWLEARPVDGEFDTYLEAFIFTTPPLPSGQVTIDLRVLDSAGNELIQTLDTVSVVDPVDDILDTTLIRSGQQSLAEEAVHIIYHGQGVSSTSTIAGIYYRIDDAPWQLLSAEDGAFDGPQETFTFRVDLASLSQGTHLVQAHSVDGAGHVETSPASDLIVVEATPHHLFLPLVIAGL
jgi:hypothetical protein